MQGVVESSPFVVGGDVCCSGSCGVCAEVDYVGALVEDLVGACSYLVVGVVFAAVEEGVGGDVEDSHDEWFVGGDELSSAVDGEVVSHCVMCLKREKLTLP